MRIVCGMFDMKDRNGRDRSLQRIGGIPNASAGTFHVCSMHVSFLFFFPDHRTVYVKDEVTGKSKNSVISDLAGEVLNTWK